MDTKKILMYFVSFLTLSLVFTGGYYFSYKKALEDFNRTAEERNNDFMASLEDQGLMIVQDNSIENTNSSSQKVDGANKSPSVSGEFGQIEEGQEVDNLDEIVVMPTTKYVLQTYNVDSEEKTDDILQVPSYLVGLNREEVIKHLDNYMEDLPWNEFKDGLRAYELLLFSEKEVIIRKTYNPELVQYEYYIKSVNGNIVVYYSDRKTVYEYTNMSINKLNQEEKLELEEGYFIKDLDELYAVLEHYTS